MSCGIWSLCSVQPLMICLWSCIKSSSCKVVYCSSFIIMQSGILVVVCMASVLSCIPGISASLFSLRFCLDSLSAMNRSGPGLYMILTPYRCILSRICCGINYSVAMSFLDIDMSGLWSVIILSSFTKQWWWNFPSPYSIHSASLSMLLYPFCLYLNACMLLPGASSLG